MDRLSALDVSFLYFEEPSTPMHVGGVLVFQPPERGFDHASLTALIERRLALAPRFRQKVKWVPGRLANPVWVDDTAFDLGYHVRRSALPRPGSDPQLHELVARLISRRLDRSRPLWELYLVEGLSGGRVAIITKTHQAMVDGVAAIDLQQVLFDRTPQPRAVPDVPWRPRREPSGLTLLSQAVEEVVRRPPAALDALRLGMNDLRNVAGRTATVLTSLARAAQVVARPAPSSPLNVPIGEQRRFAVASTSLDDYRNVRKAHAGTVNDVVLATCAGALRAWLLSRGEPVVSQSTVRALLPVSMRHSARAGGPGGTGGMDSRVSSFLVDLPVGEPSPVVRLARISYALQALTDAGRSVGADALVALSGFAPPTLHALGARVAHRASRRLFNVVITNVPGPQFRLYIDGARMSEAYPAAPLAKNMAVSIGLTSYDGAVYYGLTADRDAMSDVDTLATLIEESLAELVETVR
ncbi:MAG: wax ester/triacylglycerol synthase family O-acyltransferase [Actinobacteria bacterium]|nr:wax ester/triacylglycerol synthase family O-acyltransferase [Actinomycetota bacterium]MBI3687816.1 wax ester/triacylglycerol synthase family O-acyltransferase [Actinomycetota bacterium]